MNISYPMHYGGSMSSIYIEIELNSVKANKILERATTSQSVHNKDCTMETKIFTSNSIADYLGESLAVATILE